ncbi:MAG: hypothetical protein RIF41_27125 [Polyangiaceae bacterium]
MTVRHVLAAGLVSVALVGCGSTDPDSGAGGAGGTGGFGGVPVSDYQDNFVPLARMDGSTFVEVLEVKARQDGWVFFCSGVRGLTVVDARDPAAPAEQWLTSSSLGSGQYPRCQHLAMSGGHLYMSNRGDEIQPTPFVTAFTMGDLDANAPVQGPSFTQDGLSFEGLAADGDLLYVAAHEDGVLVLQNTGAALVELATLGGLGNAWGLDVVEGRLYVADGAHGLAIADVADPSAPALLGTIDVEGSAQHVVVDPERELAFVAASSAGMVIVDVSDPNAPSVVSRADTPGTGLQVALSGSQAYLADWNEVRVFDVSDASAPVQVASERVAGVAIPRVLGVAALDDVAFLGEWTGLYSYRFTPGITAPEIRVASDRIDLGTVAAGEVKAAAIIVDNEGLEPLVIDGVSTDGIGMTLMTDMPQTIAPGEKAALEVWIDNPSPGPYEGSAFLVSDDPDETQSRVELVMNTPTLGVGDEAPEVLVNLVGGGNWTLESQLGNVVLLSYFATF